MLTPQQQVKARRLRELGIVNPQWTVEAAHNAGLELAIACAFLEQESGGGHNVFGHDQDAHGKYIFPAKKGTVAVTEELYTEYKRRRGPKGKGGMQGVGPMQLTWYSFQDRADELGGCWHPRANMQAAFEHAADLIRRNGLNLGIKAYNGSGPQADHYLQQMLPRIEKWRAKLKVAPKPLGAPTPPAASPAPPH